MTKHSLSCRHVSQTDVTGVVTNETHDYGNVRLSSTKATPKARPYENTQQLQQQSASQYQNQIVDALSVSVSDTQDDIGSSQRQSIQLNRPTMTDVRVRASVTWLGSLPVAGGESSVNIEKLMKMLSSRFNVNRKRRTNQDVSHR